MSAHSASSRLKPPSSSRVAAPVRAADASSTTVPSSASQLPGSAAALALEDTKGELDAAKEYIAFLEEQMSSQLAESKAAASAAQNEVARLNEVVAACASSSEASVRSMDATANEGTALGSSQLRQLMEQLADTELQVIEARAQRDEALLDLAVVRLKLREAEAHASDAAEDHAVAAQQGHLPLQPQATAPPDESSIDSIESLKAHVLQLQGLLMHSQEQQRQQLSQHEQQRSLLQLSCEELQAEAAALRASLTASRSEAELLQARVAEVEAVCEDLRLDKELLEAEAEDSAANFVAGLDHAADGATLEQLQAFITENKSLHQRLIDDRAVAAAAAALAAAEHCKEVAAMREEIADLRLLCSAAGSAESIVASLTDENAALVGAARALQVRVAELEELVDISRMLEDAFQEREGDLRRDVTSLQDEVISLRRKLLQVEAENLGFQERLSGSLVQAAAAVSGASRTNGAEALKLVVEVQHRDIEILRDRLASADRAAASANMDCIIHVSNCRAAVAVAAAVPLPLRRLLQACASLLYGLDVQLLILDWIFCIVCSRAQESEKTEDCDLAHAILSCFDAVHDLHALVRGCDLSNIHDVNEEFFGSLHNAAQSTETLRMLCLSMNNCTADAQAVAQAVARCCASYKAAELAIKSCSESKQRQDTTISAEDANRAAILDISLRKCILVLLHFRTDSGMLRRVLHQAQCLQLPLLLRSITNAKGLAALDHFVPLFDVALRHLENTCCSNTDPIAILRDSEFALQQLRDAVAALSYALRVVPLQMDADDDKLGTPGNVLGVTASAFSGTLIKDASDSVEYGVCFLGRLVSRVRVDLEHAVNSVSASKAAASSMCESLADLSSSLEIERSAHAAADIKAALLQRECQNLRDELARAFSIAAAESSSSKAQLQLMSSQMSSIQSANDVLIDDVQKKVSDLNRLQLRVQQLEQQHVYQREQPAHDHQSSSWASKEVAVESGQSLNDSSSAMRLLLQAGDSYLCARVTYAASVGMAAMPQPRMSLQALAAAANLAHERAAVRKSRVDALVVVDLCSSGACAYSSVEGEGVALNRYGRCLQAALSARIFARKLE